MSTDQLKSPVGEIVFMSVNKTTTNKKTGKKTYTIRIAVDPKTDTTGWLEKIKKVNKKLLVTANTYDGENEHIANLLKTGVVLVASSSKNKPVVLNTNAEEIEEEPIFYMGSTGTAQILATPWVGEKGGSLNLDGIILHSLEHPENGETSEMSREERVAKLKALALE